MGGVPHSPGCSDDPCRGECLWPQCVACSGLGRIKPSLVGAAGHHRSALDADGRAIRPCNDPTPCPVTGEACAVCAGGHHYKWGREDGYAEGLDHGRRGRGSRRRYRAAVVEAIERHEERHREHAANAATCQRWATSYSPSQRRAFAASIANYELSRTYYARKAHLHEAATRRCRRILAALDLEAGR